MTHRSAQILRFAQLMVVSTAIFWLSLTPTPPQIKHSFWGWDKIQHALAYAVLSLSTGRFFSLWNLGAKKIWGTAFVCAIVFGGLIEVLQGVAGTGRSCEWNDLVADASGALVVCVTGLLLHGKK